LIKDGVKPPRLSPIKGNRYADYEMFRITPEMVENIDVSLAKPKGVTMNYCQRAGSC
jgi:hypothetical protein